MLRSRQVLIVNANMSAVFKDMLGSLGGSFEDAKVDVPDNPELPKLHNPPPSPNQLLKPMNLDNYTVDEFGLRRRYPKRDKRLSSRQWKKQRRIARQSMKQE